MEVLQMGRVHLDGKKRKLFGKKKKKRRDRRKLRKKKWGTQWNPTIENPTTDLFSGSLLRNKLMK